MIKKYKKKFKHARDFGISGSWNKNNAKMFKDKINEAVTNASAAYKSKYRGEDVYVFYNKKNSLGVYTDLDGNFISGWKLSKSQIKHHKKYGVKVK